jgi:hypothetical protein
MKDGGRGEEKKEEVRKGEGRKKKGGQGEEERRGRGKGGEEKEEMKGGSGLSPKRVLAQVVATATWPFSFPKPSLQKETQVSWKAGSSWSNCCPSRCPDSCFPEQLFHHLSSCP